MLIVMIGQFRSTSGKQDLLLSCFSQSSQSNISDLLTPTTATPASRSTPLAYLDGLVKTRLGVGVAVRELENLRFLPLEGNYVDCGLLVHGLLLFTIRRRIVNCVVCLSLNLSYYCSLGR